jgi:cell wall-associated NlpC family hydrolase
MRKNGIAGLPGILVTVLLAAGCAATPARHPESSDVRGPIAELALSMVGVPYRYGGADPREGFDCSGLVYYTFASNGHVVPRTSRDQFNAAHKIPLAEAAEGDLVFFRDQEKLSHVGIYLGDGRFVHAPSSGGTVNVASIDAPYYQRHLVAVGRLLP